MVVVFVVFFAVLVAVVISCDTLGVHLFPGNANLFSIGRLLD